MFRLRGGWWQEASLAALFVLITIGAMKGWTADVDLAVRSFFKDHQNIIIYALTWVLNRFGQGFIVCWVLGFGLSALLWWRRRDWKVFLPWAVAFALTYVTLGPLKIWSKRTSPNSDLPDAVEFFNPHADWTMAFPSGHVVNSIVWWGVIVIIAARLWPLPAWFKPWMRFIPAGIVVFTTSYMGHHWLTDGLAAVALGLLLDRFIHRFRWDEIIPR